MNPTPEAVEAAARALAESLNTNLHALLLPSGRVVIDDAVATAALTAAMPLIRSQVIDELIEKMTNGENFQCKGLVYRDCGKLIVSTIPEYLRAQKGTDDE